jgi:uncharacterized protein (TIRG00374 family)
MRLTLLIGVIFAIVFLLLALRDTDTRQIVASLADTRPLFVPLISAALMLQFWFKAVRWRVFLKPFSHARSSSVLQATVVGYLANLIFPLYVGEIARGYLLAKQLELRYAPVLATMLLERIFDFLSVLLIAGLILTFDKQAPGYLRTAGIGAGGAGLILLAALGIYLRWTDSISRWLTALAARVSTSLGRKVGEQIELGRLGLQAIREPRALPGLMLLSLMQWGAMGLCIFAGMLGVGLKAPVSAGFVVLALTVMAVTLPSSPGFFGTIQLSFTLGLSAYGVAASEAFAASALFHLTIYVTGWIAGLYFLRRTGLTLGKLGRIRAPGSESGPAEAPD